MSATGRGAVTGHEREKDDFYRTPAWAVRAILPHLNWGERNTNPTVLDPFCGDGAILDVAGDHVVYQPDASRRWTPSGFGIEIDSGRAQKAREWPKANVITGDSFNVQWPDATVLVTNPPFKDALRAVQRAVKWSTRVPMGRDAAFLLRLAFLESEERVAFHKTYPADIYALPKRPAFCASITCKPKKGKENSFTRTEGCGWHATQAVEAPRPKVCPVCGGKLDVTTTDMAAYAWWVWGPGRGGRWRILDCDEHV